VELMQFARVIVQASEGETFGYSLIEPVLFGLPLVTTRVGVALELERAGFAAVVDRNDAVALASALDRELQIAHPAQRAIESERFVRERCDIPVVVNRLVSMIRASN
jgi:glycosyltransferase involved in cell wall biosynthesis